MDRKNKDLQNFIPFVLGIDDTDSTAGMCTTYLGTKIVFHLLKNPLVSLQELPYLIRLNPNIPFRTKGNGSVIIKGQIHVNSISWLESSVSKLLLQFSHLNSEKTNPGLVIVYNSIPDDFFKLGNRALWNIIDLNDIEEFLKLRNVFFIHPKSKRGLIGCLAGIGLSSRLEDYTFELLQYRKPPYEANRNENTTSVWQVDEHKYDLFNCVDYKNKTVKIFPKGLDPVFCGIRGENPSNLLLYWKAIQPQPLMECWMIFKTNQGTDQHLIVTPIRSFAHNSYGPFKVIVVEGIVTSNPLTELGGHVFFHLKDKKSSITKKCYAYEPTKEFRSKILRLTTGDEIVIFGNVRPSDREAQLEEVINLEKILINKLAEKKKINNPLCPKCLKRMESAGKNQPFRCKICKNTLDKSNLEVSVIKRELQEKRFYLPAIDSQRHLTKPLTRTEKNKFNDKNTIDSIFDSIFDQLNQ